MGTETSIGQAIVEAGNALRGAESACNLDTLGLGDRGGIMGAFERAFFGPVPAGGISHPEQAYVKRCDEALANAESALGEAGIEGERPAEALEALKGHAWLYRP